MLAVGTVEEEIDATPPPPVVEESPDEAEVTLLFSNDADVCGLWPNG